MPIYEYSCPIHKVFEVTQSIKDEPLKECPTCKKGKVTTPVKKLISLGGFILSGNCWAKDSYSK